MGVITTALIVAGAVAGATQIAGGIQANEDAKDKASAINKETNEAIKVKKNDIADFDGQQRSAFAASGIELNAASPLAALEETRLQGQRELEAIRRQGNAAASQARSQGRSAMIAGIGGGVSSIFGGIASGQQAAASGYKPTGKVG